MDNYKQAFFQKILFVANMVSIYGIYSVPYGWFDVATTQSPLDKKGKIHAENTTFKIESLLKKFDEDFQRFLKYYKISFIKDEKKKCLTFKALV